MPAAPEPAGASQLADAGPSPPPQPGEVRAVGPSTSVRRRERLQLQGDGPIAQVDETQLELINARVVRVDAGMIVLEAEEYGPVQLGIPAGAVTTESGAKNANLVEMRYEFVPLKPQLVFEGEIPGAGSDRLQKVGRVGSRVLLAWNDRNQLETVDFSDPSAPLARSPIRIRDGSESPIDFQVWSPYLYLSSGSGLEIVELDSRGDPTAASETFDLGFGTGDGYLAVVRETLYLYRDGGIEAYELADPLHPVRVARVAVPERIDAVDLVADDESIFVIGRDGRVLTFSIEPSLAPRESLSAPPLEDRSDVSRAQLIGDLLFLIGRDMDTSAVVDLSRGGRRATQSLARDGSLSFHRSSNPRFDRTVQFHNDFGDISTMPENRIDPRRYSQFSLFLHDHLLLVGAENRLSVIALNPSDHREPEAAPTVSLQRVSNGSRSTATSGWVGIVPENAAPRVQIGMSSLFSRPVTVEWRARERAGEAVAGIDFHPTAGTYVIPPFHEGSLTFRAEGVLIDDREWERTEEFDFVLSRVSEGSLGNSDVIVGIGDNEPRPWCRARGPSNNQTASEDDGAVTLHVAYVSNSFAPYRGPTTFEVEVVSGSATLGEDFRLETRTATVPAGERSRDLTIHLIQDSVSESVEDVQFRVRIVGVDNPSPDDDRGCRLRIYDDD